MNPSPIQIAVALFIIFAAAQPAVAGDQPASPNPALNPTSQGTISARAIRPHVEYLASPQLEGRGTPRGKRLARNYIREQFERLQLEPLFGKSGYFQDIPGPPSKAESGKQGERTILGRNIGGWIRGSDPSFLNRRNSASAAQRYCVGLRPIRV